MQGLWQGVKLKNDFYRRETIVVAEELLGKILVHRPRNGVMAAGRIVETEAYIGEDDPASHAYAGRRTARNEVMYQPGGLSYIYQIYGLHFCLNATTTVVEPEAILIRAIEPLEGIEWMAKNRGVQSLSAIASGPGRLCQAFGLTRAQNALDLAGEQLFIVEPTKSYPHKVASGPRIGVDYAGDAAIWPLRFAVEGHFCLSRPI